MLRRLPALLLVQFIAVLHALPACAQASSNALAGTQSIGDAIRAQESTTATHPRPRARSLSPFGIHTTTPPIHILYVHGINQIGRNDSALLRAGICKYIGECSVTRVERLYAAGPFALNAPPPTFTYLGRRIWNTPEQWSASAPFIDRYQISGGGHPAIVLDELNWWPLVYPVKCKALIAPDAYLTGPSKQQVDVCSALPGGAQPDPDHPGRFLQYPWLSAEESSTLLHLRRHATFLNRGLKNSLIDFGFGDAILALGPLQQMLTAGIRELMVQALSGTVALSTANPQDPGPEFFFITHSLGSYLSLAALDAEWLGMLHQAQPPFDVSAEQKSAADYLSAHTASFYFLANQIELLELARVSLSASDSSEATCSAAPSAPTTNPLAPAASPGSTADASSSGPPASTSIAHWQCQRQSYLDRRGAAADTSGHGPNLLGPQIIAWSDPDDLLSWNVPQIDPIRVVNLHVHNSAFRIPPLLVWPTGAHANYAKNPRVLRVIFEPTPSS